jgi:hypothetical protein
MKLSQLAQILCSIEEFCSQDASWCMGGWFSESGFVTRMYSSEHVWLTDSQSLIHRGLLLAGVFIIG